MCLTWPPPLNESSILNHCSDTLVSIYDTDIAKCYSIIKKQVHPSIIFTWFLPTDNLFHSKILQTDTCVWLYSILINNSSTSHFEVMRNCVHVITTMENKTSICFLLPNLPAFHLMYSLGSHCRVGGFTTVPSLLSSAQSLLSNSSLFCLSFLFLDPQCVVNRSQRWVGVSTSCHLTGTPLIFPVWQLCLTVILPPRTLLYNFFKLPSTI